MVISGSNHTYRDENDARDQVGIRLMAIFDPSKMKQVFKFPILYSAWECDDEGWVVENQDGTRFLLLTSHGQEYVGQVPELREKIAEYQCAIQKTQQAIDLAEGKIIL